MLQNVALRVGNKSKHQANGFCGALFSSMLHWTWNVIFFSVLKPFKGVIVQLRQADLQWVTRQESSCHGVSVRKSKPKVRNWSCTLRPRLWRKVIHQRQPLGLETNETTITDLVELTCCKQTFRHFRRVINRKTICGLKLRVLGKELAVKEISESYSSSVMWTLNENRKVIIC